MGGTGTGVGEEGNRSHSRRNWMLTTALGLVMTGIGAYYGINTPEKPSFLKRYDEINGELGKSVEIPLKVFSHEYPPVLRGIELAVTETRADRLTEQMNQIVLEHPNIENIKEEYNRETSGVMESNWVAFTGWGFIITLAGLFSGTVGVLRRRGYLGWMN